MLDAVKLSFLCVDLGTFLIAHAVEFAMEFFAKSFKEVWCHQTMAQSAEDDFFKGIEADVEPILAGPAIAGGGTTEQIGADFDIARSALAAFGEAGDQEARALPCPKRFLMNIRARVALK